MRSNVMIFTSGGGGSSVLAGLIARKGFWVGNATRKLHFETYENERLVELNMEILRSAGFPLKDCMDLPPPSITRIRELSSKIAVEPYRQFVETCNAHRPWLWKDPRLCYTIHFWSQLADFSDCKFLFTTRDPLQEFVSMIKRRVIVSLKEIIAINENYRKSTEAFLKECGFKCFFCTFEDLMLDPDGFLARLGAFLDLHLNKDDLNAIYRGPLRRKKYGTSEILKNHILYLYFRYVRNEYVRFPQVKL
ncbi:MAG: hypothetical protein WHS46_10860 [Desulfosoma sp.]